MENFSVQPATPENTLISRLENFGKIVGDLYDNSFKKEIALLNAIRAGEIDKNTEYKKTCAVTKSLLVLCNKIGRANTFLLGASQDELLPLKKLFECLDCNKKDWRAAEDNAAPFLPATVDIEEIRRAITDAEKIAVDLKDDSQPAAMGDTLIAHSQDGKKNTLAETAASKQDTDINNQGEDTTHGEFLQQVSYLPDEILFLPRFLKTRHDNPKAPLGSAWQDPKNQKLYSELNGIVGFVPSTVDDDSLIFFDFDHVLNDQGEFINADAEKWFNYLHAQEFFAELSTSRTGIHMFAAPTKGKFPKGRRELDFGGGAKLEIFYGTTKFCLVTGITFRCEPKAPIAQGEVADEMFQTILNEIQNRLPQKPQRKSTRPTTTTDADTTAYDSFRAKLMLDAINPSELNDSDWLAVISAAKNIGIDYSGVDAWNRRDPERYNEKENQNRWDSLNDSSFNIETLHGIAMRFGYAESDARRQWFDLHPEKRHSKKFLLPAQCDSVFNGQDFMEETVEDLDNARRLEKFRGKFIHWLIDDEMWLTFNGSIWSRRSEKNSCIYPFATQFADKMMDFAKELDRNLKIMTQPQIIHKKYSDKSTEEKIFDKAKAERDKAFAVAYYFKKRKNYSAAIDLLKGCNSILITADDLNRNKNLLCVKNGVVDLQTGKLYPLDPKYLITNQADVFFDPKADTAFVEKFFHEVIPDEATLLGVLRYLGYCLTGEKIYHICQFWRGRGANGKTTILDMLIKLLGSYAIKLPTNAMIESPRPLDPNAASPALAMLDGDIRLAILDEIPRNCRLDATTFKTITGDQFITARPLYCNPRKIELRAKLILNGNHLPNFDVDDGGLQRRINNVEYTQFFPADRADVTLPDKLTTQENRSALLKILVNHAQDFYRNGLIESDAMKAAKAEYFNENDFVACFVDEYCIIGDGGEIKRKDFETKLIAAYPADTSRLKKKDLLRIVSDRLNLLGVSYTKDNHNKNIFSNIRWQN